MKKMFSRISVLLVMAIFGIFFFTATASAVPIIGTIQFEGTSQLTDGSFDPAQTFASAEGIEFTAVTVKLATGDLDGLNDTTAELEKFIFHPFVGPVTPLWTAGLFSFNLENLEVAIHDDNFLGLKGTGYLTAVGFDDTKGVWTLSTQSVTGFPSVTKITFSASSAAVAVPEPGTLLLLGSGMAGLALYRRRSMSK